MDIKLIRRLVRLMNGGKISELEIEDSQSGLRVHLRREAAGGAAQPLVYHVPGSSPLAPQMVSGQPGPPPAPPGPAAPSSGAGLHPIASPLVGTFYRAASPDSDPFVEVGARVGQDSTVCIVEAMKVMNEIKAEVAGTIVEILVENGDPVEYGQPLFMVQKG